MDVILNFKTNETVDQQIETMLLFLEKARIIVHKSYSVIERESRELGGGVNLIVIKKNKNVSYTNLLVLCKVLFINFLIYNNEGVLLSSSYQDKQSLHFILDHIKRLRESKGCSIHQFALECKISSTTLVKWENGVDNIHISSLFSVLKSLQYKIIFKTELK